MDESNRYKKLPNKSDHMCFGCSPVNPCGLRMQFYTDGHAVVSWITVADHLCGWTDRVHGGVISVILDEIMSWSALYLLKSFTVTKSLTVDFLKPVFIGDTIKAEGRPVNVKNNKDASMEGILYNSDGELCARSTGTFLILPPKVAKRMGVLTDKTIQDYERIMET